MKKVDAHCLALLSLRLKINSSTVQMPKKKKKSPSLEYKILQIFCDHPNQLLNYKQIARQLGIKQTSKKKMIARLLFDMSNDNKIIEERPGKYKCHPSKINRQTIVGKIDMTSNGSAYVVVDGLENDIYITEQNLGNALHGDQVEMQILKVKRNGKAVAKVTKVLERQRMEFVGVVEKSLKYAFLIPDSKKMPVDIFIPLDKLKGAQTGDKAIARIKNWPSDADSPFGEIVKLLGKPGENETEMHSIMVEYALPYEFPKHILEEAKGLDVEIKEDEVKKRKDYRQITTFTIDPSDAKDFDDALSIQQLSNGNIEVGVHIADVSHYLKEGSILDQEAYERATSVYLVDRVVPMLPEVLSNMACSLRPNEDKYCFSAIFELDQNANVLKKWFGRTAIHSDHRFAYEDAQKIIEGDKGPFYKEINQLNVLAKKLREERFNKGSIDFHALEVKFKLDEKGQPLGVFLKEQKDANKLIEEFMLLANKEVASYINEKQNGKAFVYRIHDKPDTDKLQTFGEFIKKFGHRIDTTSPKGISKSLNQLMKAVEGKSEENLISQLAIRTMAKAIYSTDNIGHYGLGFSHYTHFTSPIRRYPDVMVHRLLDHYLNKGKAIAKEAIEEKCKHSSEKEKLATDAERASIKFMQVKFMQDKVGEIFGGVISGVSEWGLFVELEGNKCEGLIRTKSLTDDFFNFNPDQYALIGKRTGKVYRIGDELTVRIQRADLSKKQLDFELVNDFDL